MIVFSEKIRDHPLYLKEMNKEERHQFFFKKKKAWKLTWKALKMQGKLQGKEEENDDSDKKDDEGRVERGGRVPFRQFFC